MLNESIEHRLRDVARSYKLRKKWSEARHFIDTKKGDIKKRAHVLRAPSHLPGEVASLQIKWDGAVITNSGSEACVYNKILTTGVKIASVVSQSPSASSLVWPM